MTGNGPYDENGPVTRPSGPDASYDTVEPENPLVARSLERVWEDKLRAVEAIEQEYARWRSEEPVVIGEALTVWCVVREPEVDRSVRWISRFAKAGLLSVDDTPRVHVQDSQIRFEL